MKRLVLKSSGNKNGSSAILAREFIRGAQENGHLITEYNLLGKDIRPCIGCNACGMSGSCVQKDDFEEKFQKALIEVSKRNVNTMRG